MAEQRILRYSVPGDFGGPIVKLRNVFSGETNIPRDKGDFGGPIVKLHNGVPEQYSATSTSPIMPPGGTSGSSARGGRLSAEDIAAIVELLQGLDVFAWARKAMAEEAGMSPSMSPSASTNPTKPLKAEPGLAYSRHRGESLKYSRELEALRGNRSKAAYARRQWCEQQLRESYAKHQTESKAAADRVLQYAKTHPGLSYAEAAAACNHAIQGEVPIG
jgi:hypothetical protein